jgi:hypothetical protein
MAPVESRAHVATGKKEARVLQDIYEPLVDVMHQGVLLIAKLQRHVLLGWQQHTLLDIRNVLADAWSPQRVDDGEEPHHIGHARVHALGGRICC